MQYMVYPLAITSYVVGLCVYTMFIIIIVIIIILNSELYFITIFIYEFCHCMANRRELVSVCVCRPAFDHIGPNSTHRRTHTAIIFMHEKFMARLKQQTASNSQLKQTTVGFRINFSPPSSCPTFTWSTHFFPFVFFFFVAVVCCVLISWWPRYSVKWSWFSHINHNEIDPPDMAHRQQKYIYSKSQLIDPKSYDSIIINEAALFCHHHYGITCC